jgi:hypothetical protein
MFNWSAGNLGLSVLGIWIALEAFLLPKNYSVPSLVYSPNQGLLIMGFMFFAISLINSVSRPTVLASVFTMLIGLSYFLGWVTLINPVILWTLSVVLFLGVLVMEFGIFRFGPSDARAKVLTIVPLAVIGFSLVLGLFNYNPLVTFNWNTSMLSAAHLFAVMVLCWLYVLDYAGWRPFKGKTNMWLNVIAIGAVALSVIGMYQGALFAW